MGIVYLAEDETLGRNVALKVLDIIIASQEGFEDQFRREARVIAGLSHPNIVQIHAFERIDNRLAIDMALIEGGSLADEVRKGRLTAPRSVGIAFDVLQALSCCHASGIVHRDVKPSNILLDLNGVALLSDFGLAKSLAAHQADSLRESVSSSFFVGTPRYAPPEAWDGEEPTPRWDVYSMGMVLFEAVSGKTVYDAAAPLAFVKQMVERSVPSLSEVSDFDWRSNAAVPFSKNICCHR